MRPTLTRWVLTVYLLLILAALVVAAIRLSHSTEFLGLSIIELIYLALPWSLALGIEPLSRVGDGGMIAIVLAGLVLNGFLLWRLAAWLQRRGRRSGSEA
jgi:hypothetical protein